MRKGPGLKCELRRNFAAAFRNWRRQEQKPLKQVAVELGFSLATISKWERGTCFPSGQSLEHIIAYTGQPPCHLLCAHARRCRPGGCLLKKSARG
jgi:transcriptional regulator with XRE-family HTH domain